MVTLARGNERFPVFCCGVVLAIALILSSVAGAAADESNLEMVRDLEVDNILPTLVNFADIDADGVLDIITVAKPGRFWRGRNKVLVIDGKTQEKKQEYKAKGDVSGLPAVGKIVNDDNWLDVVVACDDGKVCAFDGSTGKLAWEHKTGGRIEASPVLTDINGDGLMDVVVGGDDRQIYMIDGKTSDLLWKYQTNGRIRSPAAAGDLDGDKIPDLVVADDNGFVYAIDTQEKRIKWYFSVAGSFTCSPSIADVDGNGSQDVVVGASDGSIYAIDAGNQLWKEPLGEDKAFPYGIHAISVADINGDGTLEILTVVSGADGEILYAIDGKNGSTIWQQPVGTAKSQAGMPVPLVADMDGDGSPEIVVGGSNFVYTIDGNTGKQPHGYHVGEGKFFCTAVIDIDANGFLDIVAADPDSSSLHILSTSSKGSVLWAKMYGDNYNAGNADAALAYAHDPVGYPVKPKDVKPPSIVIERPTDGAEISGEETLLKGHVTDNEAVDSIDIKVNDKSLPINVASLPKIDKSIPLKLGENIIHIEARDAAGNISKKTIEVRAVRPDLKIEHTELPDEVDRGKTVELGLSVTNAGKGSAEAVVLIIYSEDARVSQNEVAVEVRVGDLAPGEEKTVPISVTPRENVEGDVARIMAMARDSADRRSNDLIIPLQLSPPKPDLAIAGHRIDDEDGDGVVKVGETIKLAVTVQNKGLGAAGNVKVELLDMGKEVARDESIVSGDKGMRRRADIQIEPPSILLENIPPRASQECSFTSLIPLTYSSGEVAFQVRLSDELGHEATEKIELQVRPREVEPIVPADVSDMPERWALLVGIDKYQDKEINPLRFAVADVLALKEVLVDPMHGGFKPEKVRVLTNDEATKGNILKGLTNWLPMAEENDTVLIYYSGHGIEHNGESYLLPVETDLSIISAYGIRNRDFAEALDGIKANKVITILDSCHSGGVSASARAVGEKLDSSFYEPFIEASKEASGRVTLSSSGPDQQSYEWEEKGHGVFTYYLMEGMRGYADEDNNGMITFLELKKHVEEKVTEWAKEKGKSQTPEVQTRHYAGEIPLSINFGAILRQKVLDLFTEGKLTARAMQYALNLLDKHKKGEELSQPEQKAMDLLRQVWDGSVRSGIFDVYVQAQMK